MKMKRILAMLLVFCLTMAVFAGCKGRDEETSAPADESSGVSSEDAEPVDNTAIDPDFADEIARDKGVNSDVMGWISVPGTDISGSVLYKTDEPDAERNEYYKRRNLEGDYDFNGVYYADFRSTFGDGSREQLGVNTTIYGHSITDDKEDERYKIKFGPLHNYRDEEYAKKHPYITFSTEKEDMVFEIVAAFVANCDNREYAYNNNVETGAEYVKMFNEYIKPRSYFHYDTEVDENDKFVTLSTCIYELENGVSVNWKETWMRYAVVAKLVDKDEPLKEEASLTKNENMVFDEDGRMGPA